jgi:hypothetical protein
MLAEDMMALASLAGNTVVAAAATDVWEAAKRGLARLLGRGDPDRTKVAERRLAETHEQLIGVAGADLESARTGLQAQWVTRLADLLEEDPGVEADLRALVAALLNAIEDEGQITSTHVTESGAVAIGGDMRLEGTYVAGRDLTMGPQSGGLGDIPLTRDPRSGQK